MKRAKKRVFFIVSSSIIVFTILVITGFSTYYGDVKTGDTYAQ